MYHAIVFLPLVGFLRAGFFGRMIGPRPSELITTSLLVIAAVLSWVAFFQVAGQVQTGKVSTLALLDMTDFILKRNLLTSSQIS
jgi:NADH-quinone oxidoreductase subunit L